MAIKFELPDFGRPLRAAGALAAAAAGAAMEPLAAIRRPFDFAANSARSYSRGFVAWSFAPATTVAEVRAEIARLAALEKSRRASGLRQAETGR
ncbi:hypothetical protein IMX07_12970 [bacterium]|nr:hypothetical protein [bacterium]